MLPSSDEEGMPWPQAVAGVVRPARVNPIGMTDLIRTGECQLVGNCQPTAIAKSAWSS